MKKIQWNLRNAIFGITSAIMAVGILAACGGEDRSRDTLERVREEGTIRIGYANEAPYAFRDSETGRVTGEAPEIARVILGRMGVEEVEGVLTEFGSLIPALNAGRVDIVAAGMYVLPERCAQVAFSEPTYSIGEAIMVADGNPLELHSYEDILNHDSARLGVVSGAIQVGYAQEMGIPSDRLVRFPDAPSAVEGVRAGRVDAYGGTALTVQDLLDRDTSGRIERAAPFTDPVIDGEEVRGYGAFAFRQADQAFVDEFNRHLLEFIGTEEHQNLVREFGFTEMELPGGVTTAELCARGE
ncbi:MAG: ectoine/hydroxyectoine ABC transporter substrate-binding protein EhuB [Candidatus Sumerlaeia bacterium]|nr:ectoine/hydroxyectoine ABC transporter substrate-binding protein EhuB [Candidatus Sumerlaeia bacterium]